jgi:glucoamylase
MIMAKREAGPQPTGARVPSPDSNGAFGHPGIEPRWTSGGKDGVGTTYSADSHVWFTFWNGIITECYYPTVDRPQIRDLQYLITDGKSFFNEEKRDLKSKVELLAENCLGYRCTNSDLIGVMPS